MRAQLTQEKRAVARSLRQRETPSEALLWELLRDRRFRGLKFRRQHVLRGFVVDFYCAELRLIVEVDGGCHDDIDVRAADALRTLTLEEGGAHVVRIEAAQVGLEAVTQRLLPWLSAR